MLGRSLNRFSPALLGLAIVCYLGAFRLVADFTCDDAGISFCYARNLAQGRGLVLTPHAERAEGYSNLLWVLLLSVGLRLGAVPAELAKGLSLAAGLACLGLLWRLPARLTRREARPMDALPPLLLALSAPFAFWTAGGLENNLFCVLMLAAVTRFDAERERRDAWPVSAFLLFLGALARPEGPLYALLARPAVTWSRRGNLRATASWTVAFVLPYAGFLGWRWLYFGSLWPTVYLAKMPAGAASGLLPGSPGWMYLAGYGEEALPLYLGLLAAWGLVRLCRQPSGLWAASSLASSVLFVLASGGDWMQHHRFLTPALPFLWLALGEGTGALAGLFRGSGTGRSERGLRSAAAAAAVALVVLRVGVPQILGLSRTADGYRVTFASRVLRGEIFGRMARQAGMTAAVLGEPDAGGTAWASGLDLFDITGLTDRILSKLWTDPVLRDEYVFEQRRPEFLRFSGVWAEATGLRRSPRLARDYVALPRLACDFPGDENFVRRDAFVVAPSEVPEDRVDAELRGELVLLGVTRVWATVAPGGQARLRLYWSARSAAPGDYRVEVRLAGPAVVTSAHVLAQGWLPASVWRPGETVRERVALDLGAAAPEGEYRLEISVRSEDGRELGTARADAPVRVARAAARRLAQESLEEKTPPAGARESCDAWMRRMEGLDATRALAPDEREWVRKRAARALARRAVLEMSAPEEGGLERAREAVACWVQARDWGAPQGDGDGLAFELLRRARSAAASSDRVGACRWIGLAARAAPADARLLRERDLLWDRLVDARTARQEGHLPATEHVIRLK
ncbi:MAG: hypothetical protein HY303_12630 [Candidatus Wallbacteria bacterium]|nr:hypothetical protein [Candidatus Wallbacteria bacterium]